MDKQKIKQILRKEGYKSIKIDEKKGWDIIALNPNNVQEFIEVKETSNMDYFLKPRFEHKTKEQKTNFENGSPVLLVCYLKDVTLYKLLKVKRSMIYLEGYIIQRKGGEKDGDQ